MPHRRKHVFDDDDQIISARFEQITSDCADSVSRFLEVAIKSIDEQFDVGHAEDNPELVGAFIRACAQSEQAAYTVIAAQKIAKALHALAEELDDVAGRLRP